MSATDLKALNRVALDPARSVVVEAVAGSGKTWLLVSRMVRLLVDGVAPSEILAITFTRKAAQEMAGRLRDWLYELATASDEAVRHFLREREVPEVQLEAGVKRARSLYEHFLTAQPPITLTTFHSWFLQLLKRAPLEAGALGNVNLLEETAALIDEAWERFGSRVQKEPQGALARALDTLLRDYGLESTRRLLRNFVLRRAEWWTYTRGQREPVAWALQRIAADLRLDPALGVIERLMADEAFMCELNALVSLLERNGATDRNLAHAYRTAASAIDRDVWFKYACSIVLTQKGAPRKRNATAAQSERLGRKGEERLLDLQEKVSARMLGACVERANQACYRANEAALQCGVALLDAYQAIKEERQVIDYGDIEWHAYRLVSVSEHASYMHYKLDARYRHILIDEFQDTNPLQWLTLKSWLAAAVDADSKPVVFLVGDPKQSIYRFRRAEARLFGHAANYLARMFGAAQLHQHESRRCAPAIIDVVNQVFSAESHFQGYEHHGAHITTKAGRVEVLPLVRRRERDPDADVAGSVPGLRNPLERALEVDEDLRREDEAQQLVVRLREIAGTWQIADQTGNKTRPARFRDVMILVKRRTHLANYEHALRGARIPFVTSRQGGLLGTFEAEDMIALLEFMVSPFADLRLAHVLRSPVFGCTDEDLLAIVKVPGESWWSRLQALAITARAGARLMRAHDLLGRWLAQSDGLPVHDQLDRIYFEGDVLARYAQAVPESIRDSVVANLHAFMQRALDTDAGRYPSLPRFLNELVDLGGAPPEEAPDEGIVGDAGDAVRIYTVHGAKGLEAPIVWLLDAGAGQEPSRAYEVMVDWRPEAEAPSHFSVCTRKAEQSSLQQALADAERAFAEREELNLLYVAMTRAEQALIVSGCDGKGRENSWYDKVRDAVRRINGVNLLRDDRSVPVAYGQSLEGCPSVAHEPIVAQAVASPCDERLNEALPTGIRHTALTTRGQRYGTQFHSLMQTLTALAPAARAHANRAGIQGPLGVSERDFAPMWDSAQRLMTAPSLAHFFDPSKYVRADNEIAYVTSDAEMRRIDRLVEFEREIWILDYKTGAPPEDTGLMAQYDAQMKTYCAAVATLARGKAVKGLLLFSNGDHRVVPFTSA